MSNIGKSETQKLYDNLIVLPSEEFIKQFEWAHSNNETGEYEDKFYNVYKQVLKERLIDVSRSYNINYYDFKLKGITYYLIWSDNSIEEFLGRLKRNKGNFERFHTFNLYYYCSIICFDYNDFNQSYMNYTPYDGIKDFFYQENDELLVLTNFYSEDSDNNRKIGKIHEKMKNKYKGFEGEFVNIYIKDFDSLKSKDANRLLEN